MKKSTVMRPVLWSALLALLALPAGAVKLHNKDSQSHDITIKCSSTAQTSIGANSIRDLGNGPCTVTVKSGNSSATGSGSDTLVIRNGSVGQ